MRKKKKKEGVYIIVKVAPLTKHHLNITAELPNHRLTYWAWLEGNTVGLWRPGLARNVQFDPSHGTMEIYNLLENRHKN